MACNQYSSVAAVCRSLEINRQQFNKYLSGQVYPSSHNLLRICDFFGLEEQQFGLKHVDFKLCLDSKSDAAPQKHHSISEVIDSLPSAVDTLAR